MRLDSVSKKVLKTLQTSKPSEINMLCGSIVFLFEDIADKCDLSFYDTITCLNQLKHFGYVQMTTFNGETKGVYLTHKGKYKKSYDRIDFWEFVVKSVAIPIVVAIIVSALTTWIGWMWSQEKNIQSTAQEPIIAPTAEDTTTTNDHGDILLDLKD